MTCEECIHYDVCAYKNRPIPLCDCTYDESDNVEKIGCPFQDKSKIIELPCKVGDTVYAFQGYFEVILPFFVEQIIIDYDEKEALVTCCANCHDDERDELLADIDFEPKDIGVTVFLTEEEAEEKLKEIKADGNNI